jgi:hypothetical protein
MSFDRKNCQPAQNTRSALTGDWSDYPGLADLFPSSVPNTTPTSSSFGRVTSADGPQAWSISLAARFADSSAASCPQDICAA